MNNELDRRYSFHSDSGYRLILPLPFTAVEVAEVLCRIDWVALWTVVATTAMAAAAVLLMRLQMSAATYARNQERWEHYHKSLQGTDFARFDHTVRYGPKVWQRNVDYLRVDLTTGERGGPPFKPDKQSMSFEDGWRIRVTLPVKRSSHPGLPPGRRLWESKWITLPDLVEFDLDRRLITVLPKAAKALRALGAERFRELLDEGDDGEIAWNLIHNGSSQLMLLYRSHKLKAQVRWLFRAALAAGSLAVLTLVYRALELPCPFPV